MKKKPINWYFLLLVLIIYGALYFISPAVFFTSLGFFKKIILKIIPTFVLVFILMVVINRYVNNKFIIKHIRGNKIKSKIYIVIGGLLSTGPMYMWYPLLEDLRAKGVNNGEIACFLYNRSIKPAYLPLLIMYFGLKYVIILSLVMIATSFVQSFFINKMIPIQEDNLVKIEV
jgi:uncharacterized membrane protein YraQ (UPF0718 family)